MKVQLRDRTEKENELRKKVETNEGMICMISAHSPSIIIIIVYDKQLRRKTRGQWQKCYGEASMSIYYNSLGLYNYYNVYSL